MFSVLFICIILLNLTEYQDGCENIEKQGLKNFNANILQSTHINLAYIYCVICFNKLSCVLWLRRMGFLPSSMLCPTCANDMTCKEFVRLTDGVAWSCTKSEVCFICCFSVCFVFKILY